MVEKESAACRGGRPAADGDVDVRDASGAFVGLLEGLITKVRLAARGEIIVLHEYAAATAGGGTMWAGGCCYWAVASSVWRGRAAIWQCVNGMQSANELSDQSLIERGAGTHRVPSTLSLQGGRGALTS